MDGAPIGTARIKYDPLIGTDINVKYLCITCMPEYKAKSLEELRSEDYSVSRKGPSQVGCITLCNGAYIDT